MPGILAVDLSTDNTRILTGGADKTATVFNKDTEQVVAALKGHQKKVNKVVFHPTEDVAITGSHDATVRVWNVANAASTSVLRVHDGPVTGLSLHATGDYVLTTSTDQHWAFSDLRFVLIIVQHFMIISGLAVSSPRSPTQALLWL